MKNKHPKSLALLLIVLSFLTYSCKKDDPVPEIDQELITEVTLVFHELNDSGQPIQGSSFEVVAKDAEGISLGGQPQIDAIKDLVPGKSYWLSILLYNDIADEDVTEEVKEYGKEHQFYFLGSALTGEGAFLDYTYEDADMDGNPIGLKGMINVDESVTVNTAFLRVILRHGLNKQYNGASDPVFKNYESAGGESDLDITFKVEF